MAKKKVQPVQEGQFPYTHHAGSVTYAFRTENELKAFLDREAQEEYFDKRVRLSAIQSPSHRAADERLRAMFFEELHVAARNSGDHVPDKWAPIQQAWDSLSIDNRVRHVRDILRENSETAIRSDDAIIRALGVLDVGKFSRALWAGYFEIQNFRAVCKLEEIAVFKYGNLELLGFFEILQNERVIVDAVSDKHHVERILSIATVKGKEPGDISESLIKQLSRDRAKLRDTGTATGLLKILNLK